MKKTFTITVLLLAAAAVASWAAPPPATIRQLTFNDNCWNGAWSPDGQWVVYQRNTLNNENPGATLWKIKVDGTGETKLTQKTVQTYYCDGNPEWSPDGKWIAFQRNELAPTASRSSDHRSSIWKVNSAGTLEKRVVSYQKLDFDQDGKNDGSGAQMPTWSPDGQWIAFRYGSGAFDEYYTSLNVIHPDGSGKKRITQAWFATSPKQSDFKWKPAGTGLNSKLVASLENPIYTEQADNDGARNVALVDRVAPGTNKWLTNGYGYACQLQTAWNPRGTKIAYIDDTFDYGDVWTMNANGTGKVRLTNSEVDKVVLKASWVCYNHPTFSPNGAKIAFFRRVSSGGITHRYICMMNADGSGKTVLTDDLTDFGSSSEGGGWLLSFNKQGTKLLFGKDDVSGKMQIWVAELPAAE